jgi:hypothetical protein
MKNLLTICVLFTISFGSLAQENQLTVDDCNCPKPSKDDLLNICHSIYVKQKYDGTEPFVFEYQRRLWKAACVDPLKDTPEEAIKKIQCFWNKYRVDSLASNKNIIKFSRTCFAPRLNECLSSCF